MTGLVIGQQSGTGGAASQVQGDVANGVTDSGNPVKIGGRAASALGNVGAVTNGQRVNAAFTLRGQFIIAAGTGTALTDASSNAAVLTYDDGGTGRSVSVYGSNLNPAGTWDRDRGDTTGKWVKTPVLLGTDRSATLSTASSQLMAANTLRTKFYVKNDTAIVVWINLGATAVATAGGGNIQIAANGGYFEFSGYSGAVNIIAASATPAITAREF